MIVDSLQGIVINRMVDGTMSLKKLKTKLKMVVNLNTLSLGAFNDDVKKSTAEYITGVIVSNLIMTRE